MDPLNYTSGIVTQPYNSFLFSPSLFTTLNDENTFLASLDSDMRSYITEFASEFTSLDELNKFVNKLHK